MKKLNHSLLYNKIHYLAFAAVLVVLGGENPILYIPVIFIFLHLRKDAFVKYLLIFFIFFCLRYILIINQKSSLNDSLTSISGEIVSIEENIIIKHKKEKVIVYGKTDLCVGDIIIVYGKVKKISSNVIPYVFNYEDYCKKKDIYYSINATKIEKIRSGFNIGIIHFKIINYIDDNINSNSGKYYKSLIFGDTSDLDIKEDIRKIGISHLFAISGLHIGLIVLFLRKVLKDKYICIILAMYLLVTNFSPSIIRATTMFVIFVFLKYRKLEYESLDVISITCLLLLIINPYYVFDIGFQLSFLISFSLILTEKLNLYKIVILAQGVTLPIIININNEINIISLLCNMIYVPFFSLFFLPLTFLSFFLHLDKIYNYIIEVFEHSIKLISSIENTILHFPNFSIYESIIYYFLFYMLMAKKKIVPFFIFLLLIFNKNCFILTDNVYVFDVGQGDSSLIETSKSKIMIDACGYSYQFFKKRGIKSLDYLIITHGHSDHYGKVEEVLKEVEVKMIIISAFTYEKEMLDMIENENVLRVKSGDAIDTVDLHIKVLAPMVFSDNENNNSLVVQIKISNKTFLFMGDAEYEVENMLIDKYKENLKSDIIKIGHHGSDSSSSELFLDYVEPDEAIISVGLNNKYNLPDKEILKRINERKIKLYQTSINKTYHIVMFFEYAYHKKYDIII